MWAGSKREAGSQRKEQDKKQLVVKTSRDDEKRVTLSG